MRKIKRSLRVQVHSKRNFIWLERSQKLALQCRFTKNLSLYRWFYQAYLHTSNQTEKIKVCRVRARIFWFCFDIFCERARTTFFASITFVRAHITFYIWGRAHILEILFEDLMILVPLHNKSHFSVGGARTPPSTKKRYNGKIYIDVRKYKERGH